MHYNPTLKRGVNNNQDEWASALKVKNNTTMLIDDIKKTIQTIPDFPKPGIMFKDITPVFQDPALCKRITDEFSTQLKSYRADAIIGIESRGFLFGFSISQALNIPFIMVRKAGKLPDKTVSCDYELEYATAKIEVE